MNRRTFFTLTAGGISALTLAPLQSARTQTAAVSDHPVTSLRATKRTIEVNGKSASVFGLLRENGSPGITLLAGQDFGVALANELSEPTLIHWHGLTSPWPLDGVPDEPAPLMKPGETRLYSFPVVDPGTYWMHAHTLQEQNLLAAPLIVDAASGNVMDAQEVVVMLHDFSFTPAEELLSRLKGRGGMSGMNMGGMDMSRMSRDEMMAHMAKMGAMVDSMRHGQMDLNDIDFDAYLANDHTLDDPEVVRVDAHDRVRLRIINAAAATAFTIDTGSLEGELVAVDGQDVARIVGSSFPIVMGQRLDIGLTVPKAGGAFPILALREGARERTGIILATAKAPIDKLAPLGASGGPIVSLDLEGRLSAARPLPTRSVDRRYAVTLTGDMSQYAWDIQDRGALVVRAGERVEIAMLNMSMMTHPMHLHGHHFQVVAIDGHRIRGAVRDTVAVTPMSTVTVAFDATNPGKWAFHCHHLYHMVAGMMTFLNYQGQG
jgi:FtsP/CotA-like multicopper oxidase with cupredoxin domain